MSILIREIKKTDDAHLAKMIRAVFIEHKAPQEGTVYSDPTTDNLSELFTRKNSALFVIEQDGMAQGCGGVYPTLGLPKGCAEFVKFYLSPTLRGQGYGKELFYGSIQWARQAGYNQLYIESLPHYDKAVSMYEKVGFEMLDHPLGKSGHPTCNIWMSLTL